MILFNTFMDLAQAQATADLEGLVFLLFVWCSCAALETQLGSRVFERVATDF